MSMSDSERRLLADGRDDSDVGTPGRSRVAARRLARAVASSRGDPLVRESRARDSTRARRGATKAARGGVVAFGRFVNDKARYFPLLFYLAWLPYIVSLGLVPEGPFAHGLAGVPEWCRWSLSYAVNLWPYFSAFIKTSTFWVLVVPVSAVVSARLFANRKELASLARASARRAEKARRRAFKPGWAKRRLARAAAEAAAFPSTLAESLGQALVPGGWIHSGVTTLTEELVSYPAKVAAAAAEATKRVAKRLAASDVIGVARDVAWELAEFPAILAAAAAPYARELAPTLGTLAELFVGQAPLKGHEVPDLKAFAREDRAGGAPSPKDGEEEGFSFRGGGGAGCSRHSGGSRAARRGLDRLAARRDRRAACPRAASSGAWSASRRRRRRARRTNQTPSARRARGAPAARRGGRRDRERLRVKAAAERESEEMDCLLTRTARTS